MNRFTSYLILLLLFWAPFIQAQQVPRTPSSAEVGRAIRDAQFQHSQPYIHPGPMQPLPQRTVSEKGKYKIVYLDGSEDIVFTRIIIDKDKHYFSYKANKEQKTIYPEQTKYVVRMGNGWEMTGEPSDGYWLFHTIKGGINGYSKLPTVEYGGALVFIQKGAGEVVPFKPDNVKEFVSDQEGSNKALGLGDYYNAILEYNRKQRSSSATK